MLLTCVNKVLDNLKLYTYNGTLVVMLFSLFVQLVAVFKNNKWELISGLTVQCTMKYVLTRVLKVDHFFVYYIDTIFSIRVRNINIPDLP